MDRKPNILLIVEGGNDEPAFFSRLASCFGMECKIVSFRTSIYGLYHRMDELSFQADIVDVLRSYPSLTEEEKKILNCRFAYVYLIFDFDIQHGTRANEIDWAKVVENVEKVKAMASYFTNETDPSIGKLYVNFPMYEALFDRPESKTPFYPRYCPVDQICTYKSTVRNGSSLKKLAGQLEKNDFLLAAQDGIRSLSCLQNQEFRKLTYDEYRSITMKEIVDREGKLATDESSQKVQVLATSSFFVIDYFGNANGFYDSVVEYSTI